MKKKPDAIVRTDKYSLVDIGEKPKKLDELLVQTAIYYNRKIPPEILKLYHEMLEEQTFGYIGHAIELHIKRSEYFPKISEIIKLIEEEIKPARSRRIQRDKQVSWTHYELDVDKMKEIRREKIDVSTSVKDLIDKIGEDIPLKLSDREREEKITELRRQGDALKKEENQNAGQDND